MSLYFEKKLEWPSSAGNRIYLDMTWHRTQPLLAISMFDDKKGGLVSIYDHLKEDITEVDMSPRPDIQVTSVSWNPIHTFLAIGYESGEVIVWNHGENESFEGPRNHQGPVTIVQWSPDGTVLLSCDAIGNLTVWTSNSQGHLQVKTNHDFRDPVVQITYRRSGIEATAAAAANTEKNLGKMTSWRPKTAAMRNGLNSLSRSESTAAGKSAEEFGFFVGLLSGGICYVRLSGQNEEVLVSGACIKNLLFYESRNLLLVMTEASVLGHFHIESNGAIDEVNKVKLSGTGEIRISWIKPGIMAVVSEDLHFRLWNMDTGDNYVITAKGTEYSGDEVFTGVDYNPKSGMLCSCTNKGKLLIWKEIGESSSGSSSSDKQLKSKSRYTKLSQKEDEELWELYCMTSVSLTTKSVEWCQSVSGVLALNGVRDIFILTEHELTCCFNEKVGVIQVNPNQLSVTMFSDDLNFEIRSCLQIKNFTATATHLCLWSGSEVEVYEIGITVPSNQRLTGSFTNKSDTICMFEQSLFILETEQILVKSFQGIVKQTLKFLSEEGQPITISLGGEYLTASSSKGFLKLWHVGQREAKIHASPENLHASIPDLGEIIQAKNNVEGSRVAITVAKKTLFLNSHLYIWETTNGAISAIEFPGLFASGIFWDSEDASYIALELKIIPKDENEQMFAFGAQDFQLESSAPRYEEASREIIARKKAKNTTATGAQIDRFAGAGDFDSRQNSVMDELNKNFKNALQINGTGLINPAGKTEADRRALENVRKKFHAKERESWEKDGKSAGGSLDDLDEDGLDIRDEDDATPDLLFPVMQRKQIKDYGILSEELENQILTLYVNSKNGFVRHDKNVKEPTANEILLGLDVPNLYVCKKVRGDSKFKKADVDTKMKMVVGKMLIKDFDGIQDEKKETRKALLNYTFHNLIGDADGAVKAMRSVESKEIWTNMARNCVKTKRLDIAYSCFAHLSDARAVRAIKMAEQEPELDARVAMLAIQLNMVKEAEDLYRNCGRFDLLLKLYKASRRWEDAIALCEKDYRINLRTTYHAYGKFLEKAKRYDEAIDMFEKSETFRYEIPRMLVDKPEKLEKYIMAKKDKELYQWWAQYLESGGEVESSLQYYEMAEDWLSLVRLLCFCGDVDKAVIVAERVNDKASSYHLARTLEEKGDAQKSIRFYTSSGAIGHGIRLCKENQLDEHLWNLALLGNSAEMADAAKYFERKDRPDFEKAVQLYHKAGYGSKALDLAFRTQQYAALQLVAKDLLSKDDHQTDPELLHKCATFFIQNEQFDRALDMLTAARKYTEAMDMCVQYNITIGEELAERLTAPKGGAGIDDATRLALLQKMGECCTAQGNYHLAAIKYTQAGNKMQAMKALLKSGDTARIIHFANISRNREIYIMAANYLQTTDWQNSMSTVENIVGFYTKAKAPESVAAFYESCAATIIEDARDYDKALICLRKAENSLEGIGGGGGPLIAEAVRVNQLKIKFVQAFLAIKELFFTNPVEAQEQSAKLLVDPNLTLVNRGDIYAIMVNYLVSSGNYTQAAYVLEDMKSSLSLNAVYKFINTDVLPLIEESVGKDYIRKNFGKPSSNTRLSGDVEESGQVQVEGEDDEEEEVEDDEEEEEVEELEENNDEYLSQSSTRMMGGRANN